ncbi:MAG: RNA chaperone Hfq [Oscillospiraceae bacterium]
MQKTQNIQDILLNQIRRDKQTVTFFLMNGFQLKGVVRSFDSFVVILETEGRQQMIYKHAISTIIPTSSVDLRDFKPLEEPIQAQS